MKPRDHYHSSEIPEKPIGEFTLDECLQVLDDDPWWLYDERLSRVIRRIKRLVAQKDKKYIELLGKYETLTGKLYSKLDNGWTGGPISDGGMDPRERQQKTPETIRLVKLTNEQSKYLARRVDENTAGRILVPKRLVSRYRQFSGDYESSDMMVKEKIKDIVREYKG
jgi:hypothetical protein